MKRKILIIAAAILTGVILLNFTTPAEVLPIGSALPKANMKLKDVKGDMVSMKDAARQKGLLVMFSCNTCPFVIRNQNRTKEVCNSASQNNIGVILLNSNEAQRNDEDSYEAMQAYANSQSYNWFYVVDKDNLVADEFGARRTPECFLFDKNLKLIYHGAIDDNPGDEKNVTHQYLKDAIGNLITGREILVRESRSVGCAIKRI